MDGTDPKKKPKPKETSPVLATSKFAGMRSKFLNTAAGLTAMGAMAGEPVTSQFTTPTTEGDSIPKNTIVQKSPVLEDPTLIGITWDEALAFDKKCNCAPKMEGLERWSVKLMAGSRHFGQHTFKEAYSTTQTINNPMGLEEGDPMFDHFGGDFDVTTSGYKDKPFNEFNPGIGVEYRINKTFHATAGIYKNSLYKTSVYAGVGAETNREKFFGGGIEVGGVTGYHSDVTPSALPYARFGSENNAVNVKVAFVPPIKDLTPAVATVQARINLDRVFKR